MTTANNTHRLTESQLRRVDITATVVDLFAKSNVTPTAESVVALARFIEGSSSAAAAVAVR